MQSITLIVYRLGNTMPFPLLPLNLVDWVPASHTSISSYYPIGWLPVLSYYPELLWAGCPYLMPPITLIPNMFEPDEVSFAVPVLNMACNFAINFG